MSVWTDGRLLSDAGVKAKGSTPYLSATDPQWPGIEDEVGLASQVAGASSHPQMESEPDKRTGTASKTD